MTIQILIIDDHKLVRDGIKLYLENDPKYKVVGEGSNGKEALNLSKELNPDLLLMDINMEVMNGIEATRAVLEYNDSVKVIALTMHNDYQHIKAMMDAGASGYLLKSCEEQEMKSAIKAVMEDDIYYSKEVAQTVMNNLAKKKKKNNTSSLATPLTPREQEVYKLILEEYSNQEIADTLFISIRTVEVHKRNLLEKTGAKNTTGLVFYAIKNQLFDDD